MHETQRHSPAQGQTGELPCFAELYDAQVSFVWRNLRRLGVPEAALDDALQDVFLVVHRRLSEFQHRSTLRTWIFSILRKIAKEHRRKLARSQGYDELDPEHEDSEASSPFDAVARHEAVDRLCRVLAGLEESKREVFVLVELEQLAGAEAAQALGVNLNTLYTKLRAARQDFSREVARLRARDESGGLR